MYPEVKYDYAADLGFALPPYRLDYENFRTDYGIGVLGLHWVLQIMHLPAYQAARFNVVAGCDNNEDRIREVQSKNFNIGTIVNDYNELFENAAVDVVDCTFGHYSDRERKRLDVVKTAAANGKHLMIHKPVASTLSLAVEMAEAAEKAGIHLAVNQDCRYNPAAFATKELFSPQRMGAPVIIEIQNYWNGKCLSRDEDKGAWLGHMVHHADLIQWWAGSPCVSVYSKAAVRSNLTIYEFANGTLAYHMENHSGVDEHETYFRVQTENGIIKGGHNWNWHLPSAAGRDFVTVYPDPKKPGVQLPLPVHVYEPMWTGVSPWYRDTGPYYNLAAPNAGMMGSMGSLMRGIAENRTPDNGIRSAIDTLKMCLAAEISAETGKAVNPADVPADAATNTYK